MRPHGATWRSGYAAVCKTVYTSSILVVASIPMRYLRARRLLPFFKDGIAFWRALGLNPTHAR